MRLERCTQLPGRAARAFVAIVMTTQIIPTAFAQVPAPVPAIHWAACEAPAPAGFDCATVPVPLDYAPRWRNGHACGDPPPGGRTGQSHRHPVLQSRGARRAGHG